MSKPLENSRRGTHRNGRACDVRRTHPPRVCKPSSVGDPCFGTHLCRGCKIVRFRGCFLGYSTIRSKTPHPFGVTSATGVCAPNGHRCPPVAESQMVVFRIERAGFFGHSRSELGSPIGFEFRRSRFAPSNGRQRRYIRDGGVRVRTAVSRQRFAPVRSAMPALLIGNGSMPENVRLSPYTGLFTSAIDLHTFISIQPEDTRYCNVRQRRS